MFGVNIADVKRYLDGEPELYGRPEAVEHRQPQDVRALQTFRGGAGGAMEFGADGRADVTLGPDTDLATIVSMGAIMTLRSLTPTELRDVEVAFGVKEGVWTAQDELRFARAYVRYVAEGHAPSPELEGAFEHVSAEATEELLDIELTDEMRRLFARFLT